MGRLNFFALWSLRDAPRQFISKSNRRCYQVHIPLPLPKQLVVFGLGEWRANETMISVEVLVSEEVKPQKIGILSCQTRCFTWEGEWHHDLVTAAAEKRRRGVYGKILLTVSGESQGNNASFISSTPLAQRKRLFPEQRNTDLSHTQPKSAESERTTPNSSHLGESVSYADLKADKTETHDYSSLGNKRWIWPTDKTPRRTIIGKRGHLTWSSDDLDGLSEDTGKTSCPKKRRLSHMVSVEEQTVQGRMNGEEEKTAQGRMNSEKEKTAQGRMNSEKEKTAQGKKVYRAVCPSKRWSHTMCLSDPDTAIVIGGETSDQNHCTDSLWKLEMDNDFWFPMNSSTSGPIPPCARGHSATYDPDSKAVYVYGGLRDGQRYTDVYVLNTLTWKWRLVTARGNVPTLAYHSATFYKKELFVFGGVQPSHCPGGKACSNALYIFNPEFELWYQPIVEGDRPLPRFGHSTLLLSDMLIIFGGRQTATYLNDVHILNLGFMEYTAVKYENMPPLPRGFHAALPVGSNRMLVSGGCSTVGALQDMHIFNVDTSMWSSVACPLLCSKPRAGHSIVNLSESILTDTEQHTEKHNGDGHVHIQCTLLVFGGSDCSGTFYNDTIKCKVEISADQ